MDEGNVQLFRTSPCAFTAAIKMRMKNLLKPTSQHIRDIIKVEVSFLRYLNSSSKNHLKIFLHTRSPTHLL